MSIFRLATMDDMDAIERLTQTAGAGLTTVPKTRADVLAAIEQTDAHLAGDHDHNRLLFVAEDRGEIKGISAIIPRLGIDRPFYSFKRSRHNRRSTHPKLSVTYETLQLSTDFDGYAELATLFLSKSARGGGVGKLLSFGRMAYIDAHRDAFGDKMMADIRGWADEGGISPFWENLTSKFIAMDFDEADRMCLNDGQFIDHLLPSLPIFLNLLPPSVSDCVGRPNDASVPAVKLLESVGFVHTDLCDVFDGGPSLMCAIDQSLIAKSAVRAQVGTVAKGADNALCFAGEGRGFRACMGHVDWEARTIGNDIAQALGHDAVFIARLKAQNGKATPHD
jgi:arginine N-succinyltransferase